MQALHGNVSRAYFCVQQFLPHIHCRHCCTFLHRTTQFWYFDDLKMHYINKCFTTYIDTYMYQTNGKLQNILICEIIDRSYFKPCLVILLPMLKGVKTVAERFEFQDENIYFRYSVTIRCVALVLYGESLKSEMDICTSARPWLDQSFKMKTFILCVDVCFSGHFR